MLSWERPADIGELRSLLDDLPEGGVVLPTGARPPSDVDDAPSPRGGIRDPASRIAPGPTVDETERPLLAVSTAGLAGIRELASDELTVTVGSGTCLDALQDELVEAGTWLALGSRALARSAGGAVAAGVPGPWDAAYGDLPRQVLAVRVATLEGTEACWGRAVMKNVAGYDVRRLMCGSWGRLGVLTEVTFRLWPAAPAEARCRLGCDAGALALAERMIEEGADARFRPDGVVWSLAPDEGRAGTAKGSLEVRFRGAEGSVQARRDALVEWAGDVGAKVEAVDEQTGGRDARSERRLDVDGRRTPDRSIISVRSGRRGFAEAGRRLAEVLGPQLEALVGYPLQGVLRCVYLNGVPASAAELDDGAPLDRALSATDAPVRIERGLAAELAAVERRRDAPVRAVEERVVAALQGGPRHWLSAYV